MCIAKFSGEEIVSEAVRSSTETMHDFAAAAHSKYFVIDDAIWSRRRRFLRPRRRAMQLENCSVEEFPPGLPRAEPVSLQQVQDGAADRVVPRVSDHSRTQTLAPPRQQPEHQPVNPEQQHARTALVAGCCS